MWDLFNMLLLYDMQCAFSSDNSGHTKMHDTDNEIMTVIGTSSSHNSKPENPLNPLTNIFVPVNKVS